MILKNTKSYYLSGMVIFIIAVLAFYVSTTDTPVNHVANDEQNKASASAQEKPSNTAQQSIVFEKFIESWKKDIAKSGQEKVRDRGQQFPDTDNKIEGQEIVENTQNTEIDEAEGKVENQDKILEEMVALASGENIDVGELRPRPLSSNINSTPTGEYADQIDQAVINEQARTQGIELPEVDPGSHPPTSVNLSSKPSGEHSEEIDQEAIYAKEKRDEFGVVESDLAAESSAE